MSNTLVMSLTITLNNILTTLKKKKNNKLSNKKKKVFYLIYHDQIYESDLDASNI